MNNDQRKTYALFALQAYQKAKAEDFPEYPGDLESAATDLIADLLHFGADKGFDTERMQRVSAMHFDAEHDNPEEE